MIAEGGLIRCTIATLTRECEKGRFNRAGVSSFPFCEKRLYLWVHDHILRTTLGIVYSTEVV